MRRVYIFISIDTEHDSEQSIACYDITSTGRYERQECHRWRKDADIFQYID